MRPETVRVERPPTESADRLLDIKELSEYLHIPVKSIYDLKYRRKIPYLKIGQRLRFRKSKIDSWLEAKSVEPTR